MYLSCEDAYCPVLGVKGVAGSRPEGPGHKGLRVLTRAPFRSSGANRGATTEPQSHREPGSLCSLRWFTAPRRSIVPLAAIAVALRASLCDRPRRSSMSTRRNRRLPGRTGQSRAGRVGARIRCITRSEPCWPVPGRSKCTKTNQRAQTLPARRIPSGPRNRCRVAMRRDGKGGHRLDDGAADAVTTGFLCHSCGPVSPRPDASTGSRSGGRRRGSAPRSSPPGCGGPG